MTANFFFCFSFLWREGGREGELVRSTHAGKKTALRGLMPGLYMELMFVKMTFIAVPVAFITPHPNTVPLPSLSKSIVIKFRRLKCSVFYINTNLSERLIFPNSPCDRPRVIESLRGREVVDVAAGGAHSACITASGELYTWGKGRYGRLGHGDSEDQPRPKLVSGWVEWPADHPHLMDCLTFINPCLAWQDSL